MVLCKGILQFKMLLVALIWIECLSHDEKRWEISRVIIQNVAKIHSTETQGGKSQEDPIILKYCCLNISEN